MTQHRPLSDYLGSFQAMLQNVVNLSELQTGITFICVFLLVFFRLGWTATALVRANAMGKSRIEVYPSGYRTRIVRKGEHAYH